METVVTGQLRMEGGREQPALAGRDDRAIVQRGECLDIVSYRIDQRRTNKDGRERRLAQCSGTSSSASKLSSWRPKALRRAVISIRLKRRLPFWPPLGDAVGQQDHPGAGAPDRHLAPGSLA